MDNICIFLKSSICNTSLDIYNISTLFIMCSLIIKGYSIAQNRFLNSTIYQCFRIQNNNNTKILKFVFLCISLESSTPQHTRYTIFCIIVFHNNPIKIVFFSNICINIYICTRIAYFLSNI